MALSAEELRSRIRSNPFISTVAVILVLVAAGFTMSFMQSSVLSSGIDDHSAGLAEEQLDRMEQYAADDIPSAPEFEIQTGSAEINSDNADSDVSKLKDEIDGFNGKITDEERSETRRHLTYNIAVEVDNEQFEEFVEWLANEYDVESTNIQYETVEVERQQKQIDVLLEAMEIYDEMLTEVRSSDNLTAEQIEIVAQITRERSRVAERLNDLGYEISELEEREANSRIELTFREELDVEMTPENFRQDVRSEIRNSMDSLADSTATIIALPIELVSWLLVAARYVIIGLVVAIPVFIGFKILEKLWRRFLTQD